MPAFNLTQGAAYIVITALTGTIYTLLAWSIRLFIRLKIHPPFAWDDIHCTIATLFTICDSCLILSQTAYGLGHSTSTLSPHAANTQRILGWLAVLCYVQASCFSILSVTFLLIRVTRLTAQARPAYLAAFSTGLWCLISTTILLFQCRLPAPWRTRPHSRCIDIYYAWLFITVTRSVIELSNVLIAAWLTWKIRMPVRPKVIIIGMFALRLLVVPPSITRLHYIKVSWQAADWSYARINVQIITQVALHVSTILATVPCVKNFLLVFESGNLHPPHHAQESGRRVSKRRSSTYTPNPTHTSSNPLRPRPSPARRARSELDLLRVPSATRPGPIHTLRMNSWSAPSGLSAQGTRMGREVASGSISTAEHDPEDARVAAVERRKSADSEDSRRRIKRTQSYVVDWKKAPEEVGIERVGTSGPQPQRQGSVESCCSFEGREGGAG